MLKPMSQDLRSVLERPDKAGRRRRIGEAVDPLFELAAVSRFAQTEPAYRDQVLLFEQR